MPTYTISLDDGREYSVESERELSDQEAYSMVQRQIQLDSAGPTDQELEDAAIPRVEGDPRKAAFEQDRRERGLAAGAERDRLLALRGPGERARDAATFFASGIPRSLTQGQIGLGEIAQAAGAEGLANRLRQSEQDFATYNNELLRMMGAAGEVAMAVPPLAQLGRFSRPGGTPREALRRMRTEEAERDVQAFDNSNVPLYSPAFTPPGVQRTAAGIADTAVVGAPVQAARDNALLATGQQAQSVAGRYGSRLAPEQAGQLAVEGVERFAQQRVAPTSRADTLTRPARATSLKTKKDAIYEKAFSFVPAGMLTGAAVGGIPRLMVKFPQTKALLDQIQARKNRMTQQSGEGASGNQPIIRSGGQIGDTLAALQNPRWSARLDTARDIRSEVRRMKSSLPDNERNALTGAELRQLESAITQDTIAGMQAYRQRLIDAGRTQEAASMGRAIHHLRRADQFTRKSAEAMEKAKRLLNTTDDLQMYNKIATALKNGDTTVLSQLRRILKPDEMNEIASSLIDRMGQPTGSNLRGTQRDLGFSISTFATNWNNAARNKRALSQVFPDGPLRDALNDVARVANRLADVESQRNFSGSATTGFNLGGLGALGAGAAMGDMTVVLGTLATYAGTGILLSRPSLARWVATYMRLRDASLRSPAANPRLQEHIARLGGLAAAEGLENELAEAQELIQRDNSNEQ